MCVCVWLHFHLTLLVWALCLIALWKAGWTGNAGQSVSRCVHYLSRPSCIERCFLPVKSWMNILFSPEWIPWRFPTSLSALGPNMHNVTIWCHCNLDDMAIHYSNSYGAASTIPLIGMRHFWWAVQPRSKLHKSCSVCREPCGIHDTKNFNLV